MADDARASCVFRLDQIHACLVPGEEKAHARVTESTSADFPIGKTFSVTKSYGLHLVNEGAPGVSKVDFMRPDFDGSAEELRDPRKLMRPLGELPAKSSIKFQQLQYYDFDFELVYQMVFWHGAGQHTRGIFVVRLSAGVLHLCPVLGCNGRRIPISEIKD